MKRFYHILHHHHLKELIDIYLNYMMFLMLKKMI